MALDVRRFGCSSDGGRRKGEGWGRSCGRKRGGTVVGRFVGVAGRWGGLARSLACTPATPLVPLHPSLSSAPPTPPTLLPLPPFPCSVRPSLPDPWPSPFLLFRHTPWCCTPFYVFCLPSFSPLFLFLLFCSFFLVLPSWCPHCFLLCLAASCDCHVMSRPSHPFMWAWLSRCRVCLWCHGCCLVRADVCVKVLSQSECVSCWGVGWAWNVWRCLRGEASVPHPPNFPVPATCACARVHFLSPLSALLHPSHLLLRSGLP